MKLIEKIPLPENQKAAWKLNFVIPEDLAKLEKSFFKNWLNELCEDNLEKAIYLKLFERSLLTHIGCTRKWLSNQLDKPKNTIDKRLIRLYYKKMIEKEKQGKYIIYYIPVIHKLFAELLEQLSIITPDDFLQEVLQPAKILKEAIFYARSGRSSKNVLQIFIKNKER